MDLPFNDEVQDTSTPPDIYSEQAIWLCENRKTKFKTRIQGTLAQILKQFPADYRLKLLKLKGAADEHTPATGE